VGKIAWAPPRREEVNFLKNPTQIPRVVALNMQKYAFCSRAPCAPTPVAAAIVLPIALLFLAVLEKLGKIWWDSETKIFEPMS
jgi:hypothetical protein